MDRSSFPVAVIGAGPVGLSAAAQLLARGLDPIVFERGATVGAAVADWAHVRVFSPWEYNVDPAARDLLEAAGWTMPDPEHLPTGGELIADYLAPLAAHPAIAPTFLMTTGYEQVRSVVAELAGDPAAAREVRLKLPETGVCKVSSAPAEAGCCGGAPVADSTACCVQDEVAKAQGQSGCGCADKSAAELSA